MARANGNHKRRNGTADLGFEAKLWAAADALRNNMDAAEYKRVVLSLIFLKYISDAFETKQAELEARATEGADAEDPDEYRVLNIFSVPSEVRWTHLKSMAPRYHTLATQRDTLLPQLMSGEIQPENRCA